MEDVRYVRGGKKDGAKLHKMKLYDKICHKITNIQIKHRIICHGLIIRLKVTKHFMTFSINVFINFRNKNQIIF